MTRLGTSVWLVAVAILAAACGEMRAPASLDQPGSQKTALVGPSTARQAVTDVPEIINPAEELQAFAPDGILRWTQASGADVYEVWAYSDEGLTQLAEFSRALASRQYQFTQLAGGLTYYVKLYYRVNGSWADAPVQVIRTSTDVVRPRLTNSQEELDGMHTGGTLRWTPIRGADDYEVWVYRDKDLEAFAENSGPVRITQYQLRTLEAGRTYYVQVYSRINGVFQVGGALPLSVIATSGRARIVNPAEELDHFATDGLLRWTAVTGATSYEVWIFTDPNSAEYFENSGPLTARSYATRSLRPGSTYYAQVYAKVDGQWQVGSPVKITTTPTVTIARLTNPQEELEAFSTAGTLRWTSVPGADAYEVWVFGNAGLGVVADSGVVGSSRSYAVIRLCSGAIYYAQVYARVNGQWTAGWAMRLDVTQGASPANCVPPAPVVTLTANPVEVVSGQSVTLTWSSQFATSCTASGAWGGARPVEGQEVAGPVRDRSLFTLDCIGPSGSSRSEALVTLSTTPGGPAASVEVTGTTLTPDEGDPVQLTAIARDQDGNVIPGKTFSWTSSEPEWAPVSDSGLLQTWGYGYVIVQASVDGVSGQVGLTVNPILATVSVGAREVVLDWTTDRCEDLDVPDGPTRVVRSEDSGLVLFSGNAPRYYASRGADFNSLRRDCRAPVLDSADDRTPQSYENWEWIWSLYREGSTWHALIHNEFHDTVGALCLQEDPSPANPCWYNSITHAVSTDGGRTFRKPLAPAHVVAPAPNPWMPPTPSTPHNGYYYFEGYRAPSNIVAGPDGYYYSLMDLTPDKGIEDFRICVMRTRTLADPSSWRAWDGTGFNLRMASPYVIGSPVPGCTALHWPIGDSSLTYNTYLDRFMLVHDSRTNIDGQQTCGIFYQLSRDLIHWSNPQLLVEARIFWCDTDPQKPGILEPVYVMYPSLVDHGDTTVNFERTGRTPHLYYTRFNDRGLDRDLMRVPLTFTRVRP